MANLSRLPLVRQEVWEWQYEGACVGLDSAVFFSPDAERGAAKRNREAGAKAVCAGCPVIEQCRQHALTVREPYGVLGGMTMDERQAWYDAERESAIGEAS
jgi:WhiB family redox-sensing transcriptional regulator